jgi:hypothetical protein
VKLDSVVDLEMASQMARINIQSVMEDQPPVNEDDPGAEDDGEGVESQRYVKAPAAQDQEQDVPLACEGQEDPATETADLILALDALVLAEGQEDIEDKKQHVQAHVEEKKNEGVQGDQQSIAEEEAKENEEEDTPPSSVEDADARIQVCNARCASRARTHRHRARKLHRDTCFRPSALHVMRRLTRCLCLGWR